MAETVSIEIVAIDLATQVIGKISDSLSAGLKNAALAAGAAIVAGIGAAVLTLKDLADAAGEAELSTARFNALVDTSNLAGFKDEMLDLASALAKVTRFEDENILEAEAMLATYQSIGEDVFPKVLDVTLDLAEFMKTDATSAAQTLGRAFADIEGGSLALLKRSRLLTAEQVEMAEKMAEAGDVAGAQALIIEALDGKIGDLAETMGQTFEGQKTIFMNALNDIKEDLGMKLLPLLTPVLEKFGLLAEKYAPLLAEAFDKYVIPAVSGVIDVFSRFMTALDEGNLKEFFEGIDWQGIGETISSSLIGMSESFKQWARDVDWQAVSDEISAGIDSIDWAGLGLKVRNFSANIWKGISEAVEEIDWLGIAESLAWGLDNMLAGMTGQGNAQAVIDTWVENIMQGLNINVQLTAIARQNAGAFIGGMIGGLASGAIAVVAFISGTLLKLIEGALGLIKKAFYNAFQGAMQQAITAIIGMKASVMKAVQAFIDAVKAIIGAGISIAVSLSLPNFAAAAAKISAGMQLIRDAMGGGAGGGGAFGSGVVNTGVAGGSSGGKKKAKGGPVRAGQSYLVGERGMELFTPGQSGSITPNNALGGLTLNLVYSPAFSTADKSELLSNLVPMLDEWYRRRLAS